MRMNEQERKENFDLSRKSKQELIELLKHQERLLENRKVINKLKDKGAKIKELAEKLKKLIEEREKHEQLARHTRGMHIVPTAGQIPMVNKHPLGLDDLDSDDDPDPPEEADTVSIEETLSKLQIDDPKENGVAESNKAAETDKSVPPYAIHLTKKVDSEARAKTKFKPFSTLRNSSLSRSGSHSSISSQESFKTINETRSRPQSKPTDHREESAVCPPPVSNRPINALSLQESLKLMEEQSRKEKELAIHRAIERLAQRTSIPLEGFDTSESSSFGMQYRDTSEDKDSCESEADEEEEQNEGDDD